VAHACVMLTKHTFYLLLAGNPQQYECQLPADDTLYFTLRNYKALITRKITITVFTKLVSLA